MREGSAVFLHGSQKDPVFHLFNFSNYPVKTECLRRHRGIMNMSFVREFQACLIVSSLGLVFFLTQRRSKDDLHPQTLQRL